jgi:hypothetical protein
MRFYFASLAAIVLAMGCHGGADARSTVSLTSARVVAQSDAAIRGITVARCAHAFACDDIGDDRSWEDMDACVIAVRRMTSDAVTRACASGINAEGLAGCVDDIRMQRCDAPHESVSSCLVEKLCR